MDPARYIIAVLFVTALLVGAIWWLRRMNLVGVKSAGIRVIATQNIGTRERLLVVRFGGEDVLLGVTAHSITRLAVSPVDASRSTDESVTVGESTPRASQGD